MREEEGKVGGKRKKNKGRGEKIVSTYIHISWTQHIWHTYRTHRSPKCKTIMQYHWPILHYMSNAVAGFVYVIGRIHLSSTEYPRQTMTLPLKKYRAHEQKYFKLLSYVSKQPSASSWIAKTISVSCFQYKAPRKCGGQESRRGQNYPFTQCDDSSCVGPPAVLSPLYSPFPLLT